MQKRSRTTFAVAAGLAALGLAVGAVFTVISGRQRAAAAARGLDPGAAPEWILAGQVAGGALILIGVLVALFLGLKLLLDPSGAGTTPRDAEHHVETGHQHQGVPPTGSR